MKAASITVLLASSITAALAQGTVSFYNTPGTLISAGPAGQGMLISAPSNSYYFGLLMAPPGTSDLGQFTFSGIYATNSEPSSPGRLLGPLDVGVTGWQPGTYMSFFVAGWSANLGHDWNKQWLSGSFAASSEFGISVIATGQAGDPAPTPIAPLQLFGPKGIETGFDLEPVPEPSSIMLWLMGVALLSVRWRSNRHFRPLP